MRRRSLGGYVALYCSSVTERRALWGRCASYFQWAFYCGDLRLITGLEWYDSLSRSSVLEGLLFGIGIAVVLDGLRNRVFGNLLAGPARSVDGYLRCTDSYD